MSFAEIVSTVKDVVLAVVGATGAGVALGGLSAWREQMRGRTEYELARRLLANTYRTRDAVNDVRSPYMSGAEMENPPQDSPYAVSDDARQHYQYAAGYSRRFSGLNKLNVDIMVDLAEAEAVWGGDIRNAFASLFKLVRELSISVQLHLDERDPLKRHSHRELTEAERERHEERDRVVWALGDDDPFREKIEAAIRDIETLLTPHVARSVRRHRNK